MLEWTGERYLPWIKGSQIHYEHLHRYAFATQFVKVKERFYFPLLSGLILLCLHFIISKLAF